MDIITVAIIAFISALIVGYVVNVLAPDYRKFHDGSELATALAAELASHTEAMPTLKQILNTAIEQTGRGERISFRPIETPIDPIFDSNVENIGLLPAKIAQDVVYVYQQIGAFRLGMKLIAENPDMALSEQGARCKVCLETIERAHTRGEQLLQDLRDRANKSYSVKFK